MSTDVWNIWANDGAMLSASDFRTMFGRPSGPAALLVCRLRSSLATPLTEMVIWLIGGVLEEREGRGWEDLGVNTDLNWLRRVSAFP